MTKLTRDQVIEVVGRVDDARITEIIATGATREELLEAFTLISEAGDLSAETQRAPAGRVAQLYDILTADAPEWAEDER